MSATGRSEAAGTGVVRHPDDFYATPAWCTRAILPHVVRGAGLRIIEPSCGDGAILAALGARDHSPPMLGIELDAERGEAARKATGATVRTTDFFGFAAHCAAHEYDLAIGNPPFSLAMEFVQATVRIAKVTAFLLRLPWLASQKRSAWLRENTPSVYVLPKRPSFTGKGTDATDYAWLVWSDAPPTVRILEVEAVPAKRNPKPLPALVERQTSIFDAIAAVGGAP